MTEELRLWSIGESGDVEPLPPLQQMPTEMALEEWLVGNPERLGSGIKLVGRQTRTKSGLLDLLAVDQDGRLVVYELKRGRTPGRRDLCSSPRPEISDDASLHPIM